MKNPDAKAIQMCGYGGPEVLTWRSVPLGPLLPNDVRIKTIAAAVNHTDLKIRSGLWPIRRSDPFPYTPGVELVGEISQIGDAVRDLVPGDRVITMMQGLGGVRADRAGSYAEFVTVSADVVAVIGTAVDPYAMAALGLGAVTAYEGLRRIGDIAGKRILVTGAAGGVGSSAVALAKAQKASVIGVVTRQEQAAYVRDLGADDVVVGGTGEPTPFQIASVDGILDTVGAPLFERNLLALKPGGIFCLVGAVGGSEVRFDLWDLIRPVTLTGYSTEDLNGHALRHAISAIAGWVECGAISGPQSTTFALANAAEAHAMLDRHGVNGRVLLVP